MQSVNYTNLENHRKQHRAFIMQLKRYERLNMTNATNLGNLSTVGTKWLLNRVTTSDKAFGAFLVGRTTTG